MLSLIKLTKYLLVPLGGLFIVGSAALAQEYNEIAPERRVVQNYLYDPSFHFEQDVTLETTVGDYISPPLIINKDLRFSEFLWQIGDKREETTKIPVLSFKYESSGSYTLVVSARDQHGELHVATLPVKVNPNKSRVKGESVVESNSFKSVGSSINDSLGQFGGYPLAIILGMISAIFTTWLLIGGRKKQIEPLYEAEPVEERVLLAKRINRKLW